MNSKENTATKATKATESDNNKNLEELMLYPDPTKDLKKNIKTYGFNDYTNNLDICNKFHEEFQNILWPSEGEKQAALEEYYYLYNTFQTKISYLTTVIIPFLEKSTDAIVSIKSSSDSSTFDEAHKTLLKMCSEVENQLNIFQEHEHYKFNEQPKKLPKIEFKQINDKMDDIMKHLESVEKESNKQELCDKAELYLSTFIGQCEFFITKHPEEVNNLMTLIKGTINDTKIPYKMMSFHLEKLKTFKTSCVADQDKYNALCLFLKKEMSAVKFYMDQFTLWFMKRSEQLNTSKDVVLFNILTNRHLFLCKQLLLKPLLSSTPNIKTDGKNHPIESSSILTEGRMQGQPTGVKQDTLYKALNVNTEKNTPIITTTKDTSQTILDGNLSLKEQKENLKLLTTRKYIIGKGTLFSSSQTPIGQEASTLQTPPFSGNVNK